MIPEEKLVGKNPRLENGVYRDDYTSASNQFASVDEVFGEHRQAIANGEFYPAGRLIMDTLGAEEYERHLQSIIRNAAEAGEWVGVIRGPRQTDGLDVVTKKCFGYIVYHEDKKFLLPSAMYVAYCKAKLEALVK